MNKFDSKLLLYGYYSKAFSLQTSRILDRFTFIISDADYGINYADSVRSLLALIGIYCSVVCIQCNVQLDNPLISHGRFLARSLMGGGGLLCSVASPGSDAAPRSALADRFLSALVSSTFPQNGWWIARHYPTTTKPLTVQIIINPLRYQRWVLYCSRRILVSGKCKNLR